MLIIQSNYHLSSRLWRLIGIDMLEYDYYLSSKNDNLSKCEHRLSRYRMINSEIKLSLQRHNDYMEDYTKNMKIE